MATAWVYSCSGTRGTAVAFGDPAGSHHATCSAGAWIEIETEQQHWWGAEVDGAAFSALMGACILFAVVLGLLGMFYDTIKGK